LNLNILKKKNKKNKVKNKLKKIKVKHIRTGVVIYVTDEIVHCVGLPNVSFGEIVKISLFNKSYRGLVVNIA